MVFYALSGVVALFCAMALGLGPVTFALAGVAVAVVGFRARHPRWWGLPACAAGVGEALGAISGLATRTVALVTVVIFGLVSVARMTARRSRDRSDGLSGWSPPDRGVRR